MQKFWDPNRWTFHVEEVRNLCWRATADDQQGTVIERTDWAAEPVEILDLVKREAAEITQRRRDAAANRSGPRLD